MRKLAFALYAEGLPSALITAASCLVKSGGKPPHSIRTIYLFIMNCLKIIKYIIGVTLCISCSYSNICFCEQKKNTAEKREYTFLLPAYKTSGLGISASQLIDTINSLVNETGEKAGVKINFETVGNPEDGEEKLDKEFFNVLKIKGDFTILSSSHWYLKIKQISPPLKPFLAFSFFGSKTYKNCIYTTGNIKTLEDLKGKRISYVDFNADTRSILYKNGVNVPLQEYFKEVLPIEGNPAAAYALLLNEVDMLTMADIGIKTLTVMDPKFKRLRELSCGEPIYMDIYFYVRKTVPEDVLKIIHDSLINFKTMESVKKSPYHQWLKKANVGIYHPSDKDIKMIEKDYLEKVKKLEPWNKEIEKWKKSHPLKKEK